MLHAADQPSVSSASLRAAPEAFNSSLHGRFGGEASASNSGKVDGISSAAAEVEYEEQAQSSPRLGAQRLY